MTQMPWDEVPDINITPGGVFHVKGVALTDGMTGTNKKMYKAQIEVVAPEEYAGHNYFENFVFGSDDDPQGVDVNQLKKNFAVRRMKQMCKAAQVPLTTMEAIMNAFQGTQFMVQVSYGLSKSPGYEGTPENTLRAFYKLGERTAAIDPKSVQLMNQGAQLSGQVAAPAPPTQVAAPPANVAAPPQPPPVAAPPQPAAPAPPEAPTPTQPAPTNMAPEGQTSICPKCSAVVPLAEFAQHMAACLA